VAPRRAGREAAAGLAYAGASHLILAAGTCGRLRELDDDFERLRSIMLAADPTTVQLTWREASDRFRARNSFPAGNVVEDPATGAAAAARGAYLRWRGEVRPPARFTISQGVEMGRPRLIEVEIPEASGGIRVSGTAVSIASPVGAEGHRGVRPPRAALPWTAMRAPG
jgi:PhzF family phenazine biosynthesis protein